MKLIAYYRVSTAQQGRSGLGLAAQRQAVQDYARSVGGEVVEEFKEVESGSRSDRPQLAKALRLSKLTGATLVIAKLDRLSRNAAFLMKLQDERAKFVAADMPNADSTTVGIMAVIAQAEREAISKRTKAALAAAKARGVKLGNPNGAAALKRAGKGNEAGSSAASAKAAAHAAEVLPHVEDLQSEGIVTLAAIAESLNTRGVRTLHGKTWHKTSVKNLLARAG